MKKIFAVVLSLAAVALPVMVQAQVAKQVEVTKAYVPEIADAVKLPITPNMVDTVKMRPEIDYSITPKMFSTDLSTHRFKPATVTYWEFNRPKTFYAKVGAGYPLNSVADIYASSHNARVGYIMAYANHHGEFGKRPNFALSDVGKVGLNRQYNEAMQMQNRVGVAGGAYCGKRIFEGDLNYNSEMYDRYAGVGGRQVDFEDVNLKLRFGDNFSDLSRTNFNIALSGNFFHDKSDGRVGSMLNMQEAHAGVEAKVARQFKLHYASIVAGYDGRWGVKDLSGYANNRAFLGLRYGYTFDFLEMLVGVDYCYDRVNSLPKAAHHILPMAKFRFNVSNHDIITPFVEVESSVESNSYHSLVLRNPYIELDGESYNMPNTVNYDMRLGIEGRFAQDKFAYRLYAGMSFIKNSLYWYSYDYMWIRPVLGDKLRNAMSLNLELDYKPISRFGISAGVHGYLHHPSADVKFGPDRTSSAIFTKDFFPKFDAYLKARYDFGKVSVALAADFVGESLGLSFVRVDESLPATAENMKRVADFENPFYANISLDVDWHITKQCSLFVEGRNLANMQIYRWVWYRDLGIHFTLGARVNF